MQQLKTDKLDIQIDDKSLTVCVKDLRTGLEWRMQAYLQFAGHLAPNAAKLFWSTRIDREDFRILLIGLNTALVALDDKDRQCLRIGKQQLESGLRLKKAGDLVVVMTHHPTTGAWIADEAELANRILADADVHLSGHIHEPSSESAQSGSGLQIVRVSAGAVHEHGSSGGPRPYDFSIGAVVRKGRRLSLLIYPRRYSGLEFRVAADSVPRGLDHAEHRLSGAVGPRRSPAPQHAPNQAHVRAAPTLSEYLDALRQTAGQVRLPGSDDEQPLDAVWVRLSLTDDEETGESRLPPEAGSKAERSKEDLEAETADRDPVWRRRVTTLEASSLLDLAPRTLVIGAAGTGKSTLLRWLARAAAERRADHPEARIPLWLRRLPQLRWRDDEGLFDELARMALLDAGCEAGPGDALTAIRSALCDKKAYIVIDGVDEADRLSQERAAEWLARLGDRVVLASRPLIAERAWRTVRRVTLLGTPGAAAESMLRTYFPDAEWVPDLVASLRALPDGQRWLETPVLLGLAAVLRNRNGNAPRFAIDLYRQAITSFVERESIPCACREELRERLADLAATVLVPADGPCRVHFRRTELPEDRRDEMVLTGLFDTPADGWLRFAHLSLGEYLAAEAKRLDPRREVERLLERQAEEVLGANLEVLPMALALRAPAALADALTVADGRDCSDHRVLRLILRAIGYGGDGVSELCRGAARGILRLIADRLANASGRFGDAERALMGAAGRAFYVLRDHVTADDAKAAFSDLLGLPGEIGTEAHIALWVLGGTVERRGSHWWVTVDRQARAVVRSGCTVDQVRELTSGAEGHERALAVRVLGKCERHWPRLRPHLADPSETSRFAAAHALVHDQGAIVMLRELLSDDSARVRRFAIAALAGMPDGRSPVYRDRLASALRSDPDDGVRASAVDALRDEVDALPLVRGEFERFLQLPSRYSFDFLALRHSVFLRLADDDASAPAIRKYLAGPKPNEWSEKELLTALAGWPDWQAILRKRLQASDLAPSEVAVFAGDERAASVLRGLLDHERVPVVVAAAKALRGDRASRQRLVALLTAPDADVRAAVIASLGGIRSCWAKLRPCLADGEERVRLAAIDALADDPLAQDGIADALQASQHNVRLHSLKALSRSKIGARVVRDYFVTTRAAPALEWGAGTKSLAHDLLRSEALRLLAERGAADDLLRPALGDPHGPVRAQALRCIAQETGARGALVPFVDDRDHDVRTTALEVLSDQPAVESRLLGMLEEDQWPLRTVSFRYLIDLDGPRRELRRLLASPVRADEDVRASLIGPLLHDPESRADILKCLFDRQGSVRRVAQALLSDDAEARRQVRERARDGTWLCRKLAHWSEHPLQNILANDPEAWPILREHLRSGDGMLTHVAAPLLALDEEAWPALRELLRDGPFDAAAIRSLGHDAEARPIVLEALQSSDSSIREAATSALRDVPEARAAIVALLGDDSKGVRAAAIEAVKGDASPVVRNALLGRLPLEPDDELRHAVLLAVRSEPQAVDLLRDRLHRDFARAVRGEAARALCPTVPPWALPLDSLPSVRTACDLVAGRGGETALSTRFLPYMANPMLLDAAADPELTEAVLGWCLARLTWASADGTMRGGRVFGEVAQAVGALAAQGKGPIVVRVAMDASECPVQRLLRPSHNLIEAWRVARCLTAPDPPSLFMACADVAFEQLRPPTLAAGEMSWGPTFFGFRLRASPS